MLTQAAYNQAQRRKRKQTKRQNLHTQRRDAQRQTNLYSLANQALRHQHTILSGRLPASPAVLTAAAGLTNLLDHLDGRSPQPRQARQLLHGQDRRFSADSVDHAAAWMALVAEADLPIAQREAPTQIVDDGYVTAAALLRHVRQTRPTDLATSLDDLMRLATADRIHSTTAA